MRRDPRVHACCRVDVRQRYAAWSAVAEELSARGCRIVTSALPRLGALLDLRLSSDLFPEELGVTGEVVWMDSGRIGVLFVEPSGAPWRETSRARTWLDRLREAGRVPGSAGGRLVPVIGHAALDRARRPRILVVH